MSELRMILELECDCGHISKIDTDKCKKLICPKCGKVIFEKEVTEDDMDREESI